MADAALRHDKTRPDMHPFTLGWYWSLRAISEVCRCRGCRLARLGGLRHGSSAVDDVRSVCMSVCHCLRLICHSSGTCSPPKHASADEPAELDTSTDSFEGRDRDREVGDEQVLAEGCHLSTTGLWTRLPSIFETGIYLLQGCTAAGEA